MCAPAADGVRCTQGPYSASKAALNLLSEALRRELHPFGIRVVIVKPGTVHSPAGYRQCGGLATWYLSQCAGPCIMVSRPHWLYCSDSQLCFLIYCEVHRFVVGVIKRRVDGMA